MRPGTQTQTVAVATQTNVSSAATINSNSTPVRTQVSVFHLLARMCREIKKEANLTILFNLLIYCYTEKKDL